MTLGSAMRPSSGWNRARDAAWVRRACLLLALTLCPGTTAAQTEVPQADEGPVPLEPVAPEAAPDVGTVTSDPTTADPGGQPAAKHPPDPPPVPEAPPPFVDFEGRPADVPPPDVPASAGTDALPSDAPEAPNPPTRRQLCTKPEEGNDDMVDDMQQTMEETTCAAALWLDGLFGEPRNLDTARRTSGFLETSVNWSDFKGWDERVRFRVRFRLLNLKNRVSAVFGRDNEDDVVRDRSEGFAVRSALPRGAEDDSWLAGLGYSFPGSKRFKTDFRVGVASLAHPRTYVQQRARYIVYSDEEDLFYVRGTAFWNNRQGFGFTTGADYSRTLTETLLLRFTNVGTVSQETEGLDWFSGLILYQNLREERAMAYELLIRGQTDEPEPLYEYGGRVVYRHPLLPRRLYAELLAGYSWPREDPDAEREGSPQVGLSIEMPFGQKHED